MPDSIRKMQEGHNVGDIDRVITEVDEAKGDYESLLTRFEALEERISALEKIKSEEERR